MVPEEDVYVFLIDLWTTTCKLQLALASQASLANSHGCFFICAVMFSLLRTVVAMFSPLFLAVHIVPVIHLHLIAVHISRAVSLCVNRQTRPHTDAHAVSFNIF